MSLKGRQQKAKHVRIKGQPGRVVGTAGRRVVVRDEAGERVCYLSGQRAGENCAEDLDTKGDHASTCKVGGGVGRKHDGLVQLLARLLRAAGYLVETDGPGTWEPRWDRIPDGKLCAVGSRAVGQEMLGGP